MDRVVLYHKQATSARTLFLDHAYGSVVGPQALPPLSSVPGVDDERRLATTSQPETLHQQLADALEWNADAFLLDLGFRETVDTPPGPVIVYLAGFTSVDPPWELAGKQGGRFRALTELRGRHPAEMELLRRAYSAILGG